MGACAGETKKKAIKPLGKRKNADRNEEKASGSTNRHVCDTKTDMGEKGGARARASEMLREHTILQVASPAASLIAWPFCQLIAFQIDLSFRLGFHRNRPDGTSSSLSLSPSHAIFLIYIYVYVSRSSCLLLYILVVFIPGDTAP